MAYVLQILGPLWEGTIVTLELFAVTLVLSLPLGLGLCLARVAGPRIVARAVSVYIWLTRGTPLLLQMLFVCYALPNIPVIGVTLPHFQAAIVAFALNYAAYFAEIFRGGIESVSRGQYEAAKTLGFTYSQTMRRIILPQTIRRILPPLGNETITLVKDTALIYALAINELLRTAQRFVQKDFTTTPFLVAAAFYLIMTLVLTLGLRQLEKRYAVYDD